MDGQYDVTPAGPPPLPLPPPSGLEAVLLDAGNTLVFLDHGAVAQVANAHGVPLSAEVLTNAEVRATQSYARWLSDGGSHAHGWNLFMRELLRFGGAPDVRLDELVQAAREEHERFNLWRRVPEGTEEALARLAAAHVRLAVVSNSEGALPALFARVGLAPFFELVVDSANEGVRKPDPEIFLRALSRLGVTASRAVYVGDIPDVDVRGATAAGIAAVLIDPLDRYPAFPSTHRVQSLAELADLLL